MLSKNGHPAIGIYNSGGVQIGIGIINGNWLDGAVAVINYSGGVNFNSTMQLTYADAIVF